ncbi:MAG: DsbE family thiol:disulfide interchange protein [Alphaproteobacteria bacterium]
MRRVLFILPLVGFLGLAALLVGMLRADRDPSHIPSALIDRPVPEFELPGIEDRPGSGGFSSADLRGQVTLVNIFASWCLPCLAEHPLITRLAEEGHTVYGINHRDTDRAATRWLERHGDPYTRIGVDADARVSIEWGVTGVPETFIVDRNGRIRHKHTGPLTPDALESDILPILKELQE